MSIFSEKAYQRDGGLRFEAIGNVVIVNGGDTLYGESAIFYKEKQLFKIEGNVRFVGQGLTLYASQMLYWMESGRIELKNARLISESYTVVAKDLVRTDPQFYEAEQAEFSTCQDCPESWSVFGDSISLEVDEYVKIRNGVFRINGIAAMYIPYIIFPVKKDRETGLLIPIPSSRGEEGYALQLPFFWALSPSSDITISPSIWGKRGPGTDLQVRKYFKEKSFFHFEGRGLRDSLYTPESPGPERSGDQYYRAFGETQLNWHQGADLQFMLHSTDTKDLQFIQDFALMADQFVDSSSVGSSGFVQYRKDYFSLNLQGHYRRDQIFPDPEAFNDEFVQQLPSLKTDSTSFFLLQGNRAILPKLALSISARADRFFESSKQLSPYLRNAYRVSSVPEIQALLYSQKGFQLSSKGVFDYQYYNFSRDGEENFYKYSTPVQTEFAFELEKTFGLAAKKEIPVKDLVPEQRRDLYLSKDTKENKPQVTIGELSEYNQFLSQNTVEETSISYRHHQKVQLLHHWIPHEDESGNSVFREQISDRSRLFDWRDSIRSREFRLGGQSSRVLIPPENTLELRWGNSLISKSPQTFDPQVDQRYLQENFAYNRLGYFELSQGVLLSPEEEEPALTRLKLSTGLSIAEWSFNVDEFYFHDSDEHILNLSVAQDFSKFYLGATFSYSSFDQDLNQGLTWQIGLRPLPLIGIGLSQTRDLINDEVTRSQILVGYRPKNDCWLLDVGIVDNFNQPDVYTVDLILNFGDKRFRSAQSSAIPGNY